jgi:NhaP-type Na+/H+ or K+/H+ antiporter
LTPTDPVLVSAVISGPFAKKYVPDRVKYLLAAESAANDALGFCFLYIPFYFTRISPVGDALGWFLLKIVLYQVLFS